MGPLPAAPGCDCRICRPDDLYDERGRRTIDTVLKHGWQVTVVSKDACSDPDHEDHEPTDEVPDFAYTVGLGHRCGHPELLMAGLEPLLMHRAINGIARQVLEGRRLHPGDVLEDVLAGVPVVLERVTDEALRETVTESGWLHRVRPEALMIVWPSTSGLFAWQPGAPALLDELQPRSWREPFTHTGAVSVDPPWTFPVPPDHMAFSCTHVIDDGESILWAARQSDAERGEDWTIHCGAAHSSSDMRLLHIAHLVRSAPSLTQISGLGLDEEAERSDVEAPWQTSKL